MGLGVGVWGGGGCEKGGGGGGSRGFDPPPLHRYSVSEHCMLQRNPDWSSSAVFTVKFGYTRISKLALFKFGPNTD